MFRLKKIDIKQHKILGTLQLTFCDWNDDDFGYNRDIFTSVIIGANGIGKSHLMKAIADIFCYINDRKENSDTPRVPQFYFDIEYYYGAGSLYHIDNNNPDGKKAKFTGLNVWLNNIPYNTAEVDIPRKVIASTMTVSDKFHAKSDTFYIYKGIRSEQNPSITGTKTLVRKTVSALMKSLQTKVGFTDEIADLLKNLGLVPKLHLSYTLRYRNVFMKREYPLTPDIFRAIFDGQTEDFKHRQTKMWGVNYYEKIRDNEWKIREICDFINDLRGINGRKVTLDYDVLNESERLSNDRHVIEMLSALDLLTFPSLNVFKYHQEFDFEQSSSGETHLLCQMIGIMSDIEDNCLVLIDEPENSSHPNWQMKYIDWLNEIFKKYNTSHFVIATHSHFLLTNLKPESSNVIALEEKDGFLHNVVKGINTYCWSVDDILYRVFHVRNVRNSVFESRIVKLYQLLEHKDQNLEEIRLLVTELSAYRLNDDDPLNKLLNIAQKCLI